MFSKCLSKQYGFTKRISFSLTLCIPGRKMHQTPPPVVYATVRSFLYGCTS